MAETIAAERNDHSPHDLPEHPRADQTDRSRAAVPAGSNHSRKGSKPGPPKRRVKKQAAESGASESDDRAASYAALQRTFAEHLAMVRAEFREAVANYSVRVQGLLTHIDDSVADGSSALTDDERGRRARALRDALKEIESLNLKPSKGRRRDLKKVETLAEHLGDIIDEW